MRRLSLLAAVLAGCSLLPSAASLPDPYDIHVENGTTLDVGIAVSDRVVRVVPHGGSATIPAAEAGALPWVIEARTGSGRVLLSFGVEAGSVDVDGDAQQGRGGRADLSCGRLDVYVGPVLLGPAPGPGEPGDCLP